VYRHPPSLQARAPSYSVAARTHSIDTDAGALCASCAHAGMHVSRAHARSVGRGDEHPMSVQSDIKKSSDFDFLIKSGHLALRQPNVFA